MPRLWNKKPQAWIKDDPQRPGLYPGFTLIEIILVIGIIGVMGGLFLPSLFRQKPDKERRNFIASLNHLTSVAVRNGARTGKIQRVLFEIRERKISIDEVEKPERGDQKMVTRPIKGASLSSIKIPKNIDITRFSIEGINEFEGGARERVWFFIMPSGISQDVLITLVDKKDKRGGKARVVNLSLNPLRSEWLVV